MYKPQVGDVVVIIGGFKSLHNFPIGTICTVQSDDGGDTFHLYGASDYGCDIDQIVYKNMFKLARVGDEENFFNAPSV